MARKWRIEYPGAIYHVINRGNYRSAIFETAGARAAFLQCLGEACAKCGWVVRAYVLMSNHYHLALETPQGNLVAGMKWLQSTFANRFNRLRREQGHVFQGRYQAVLVEDEQHLGAVCHYIHLNPVRAHLLPAERLAEYEGSSYVWLQKAKRRPPWLKPETALRTAGGLQDTRAGRRQYQLYLEWLAETEPAQKQLNFDKMCSGWALGTGGFKRAVLADLQEEAGGKPGEADTREARELCWEYAVAQALTRLGKTPPEVAADRKSAPWKVALASHLKATSPVTNVWLARRLHMGAPAAVSRYVTQFRRSGKENQALRIRISKVTV